MLPLVALLILAPTTRQSDVLPDTLPGKRLAELIQAFNSHDHDKIETMVKNSFSKTALKETPLADWVSRMMDVGSTLVPIYPEAVLRSTDTSIVVRLKAPIQQSVAIRIDLEPDDPYRIITARLGSPQEVLAAAVAVKYSGWKTLFELADAVQKDNRLPAIAIAYDQLGQPPELITLGVRSKSRPAPLLPDDRLLVGAISKTMTATMIARLVELKKLSWNMTLGASLTKVKMLDAYKSITLDQLLHHQGNLPVASMVPSEDIDKVAGDADTARDMRKKFVPALLAREQGPVNAAQAADTDTDYLVAAFLVEEVINQPYEWLMQRYVFDPLGMSSVLIAPIGTDNQVGGQGNVAAHIWTDLGYTPFQLPVTRLDVMMDPAGRGVSCSITDLLKYGEAHLKGMKTDTKPLSLDSFKKLHTPDASFGDANQAFGWTLNPLVAGEPCLSAVGASDGFHADLTLWPNSGLVVVAVTNAGTERQPSPTMQAILAIKDKVHKP